MSKKTDQTIQKCDQLIDRLQELKKALTVNNMAVRKPVNALGVGWSQDPNTGALHHSTHGVISTLKHPEGGFEIKHGERGTIGRAPDMARAGAMIRDYVGKLSSNYNPMSKEEMDKSGYGPKRGGQYSVADNARRKMTNTGDRAGQGPNANVKSYSSVPGQLSAKQQASAEQKKVKRLSGPVKQYSPEQIAALEEARKLKKSVEEAPWITHSAVPNADRELERLHKNNPVSQGENLMATQLAAMMNSKAMMRPNHRQPTSEDMIMAGQAMGIAPTEEMIKSADQQWHGTMNWLAEATKPISQRFASEEEELAYWSSIKVSDKGGGDYGF